MASLIDAYSVNKMSYGISNVLLETFAKMLESPDLTKSVEDRREVIGKM